MKKFLILLLLPILFISCSKSPESTNGKITVFTSILPQKYFVERISSGKIDVNVLVTPGKSPATYEPTPDQVVKLSKSKILFTIGVPFEKAFLSKVKSSLKDIEIIDTAEGIKKRMLDEHHHDKDEHGHDEKHEHKEDKHHDDEKHGHDDHEHEKGADDPHTWLSPRLAKIHAKNIYDALIKADPANKDLYTKNYKALLNDLSSVDKTLKRTLKPYKGKTIFVFHPAFGYFTDEYGLVQEAIETGGKSPSPSKLKALISSAKKEKVKVIFVQPEFSQKSARAVASAIGGVVIRLNPLNPDYVNNLKNIADKIEESFKK